MGPDEPVVEERSQEDPAFREPLEVDPRSGVRDGWLGAVLLSDEIEYYSQLDPPLLYPFDPNQLKPARYQLRLGREARISGVRREVSDDKPLVIKPHQVAIVRTHERLNIPRFLIGRWNLRVNMVYKGLLWVGALQVDPGWRGYLPCPLYNMSNKAVELRFREPVFTIDFVRTTPFKRDAGGKAISKPYDMKFSPNPPIAHFDEHRLQSGPYDQLARVDDMVSQISEIRTQVNNFTGFGVAALAIIVSVIGVIAAAPGGTREFVGKDAVVLGAAAFAVFVSLAAFNLAAKSLPRDSAHREDAR